MQYEDNVYAKFNAAVNDSNQNDLDPTLLFIATDGRMIYKAFAGPATAVDNNFYVSQGFDDDTFMGVWSHDWIRNQISNMEDAEDPDQEWANLMEGMVATIAEYADGISPPEARNS